MIVLVLDPAQSTGYCLVRITASVRADIYEYGFIDIDKSSGYQGDHCLDLMAQIQSLMDIHKVNRIVVEDYFFNKRFCNGCKVNFAFRTAIHILARQNGIEYVVVNVSLWKTFVAGRSTPTSEQKKEWGAVAAKKLYIQDALWKRFHIVFPNHCISKLTRKPIAFRFDITDAVGISVYYCVVVCGIGKKCISSSVVVPEDVVFKRIPKNQYKYC